MALTAEQFHEIQEILSERRFRAEKEALEKQREVLEKVSGYADLDEKLRTLSISAMEKMRKPFAHCVPRYRRFGRRSVCSWRRQVFPRRIWKRITAVLFAGTAVFLRERNVAVL